MFCSAFKMGWISYKFKQARIMVQEEYKRNQGPVWMLKPLIWQHPRCRWERDGKDRMEKDRR